MGLNGGFALLVDGLDFVSGYPALAVHLRGLAHTPRSITIYTPRPYSIRGLCQWPAPAPVFHTYKGAANECWPRC